MSSDQDASSSEPPPLAQLGSATEALALAWELQRARGDERRCRALVRQVALDGLLPLALAPATERAAFTAQVLAAIVPERQVFTGRVVQRLQRADGLEPDAPPMPRREVPRWRRAAAAVAALAAGVLCALLVPGRDDGALARLERGEAAVWSEPPAAVLGAGARLRLARGLAEVELRGRGHLVLEGPADLELAAPLRAVLRQGRLVLNVTPAGHGYRIETPSGALVDLGTRFGVSVGADGAAEAHVLEGAVAAIPAGATEVVLARNQAARLAGGRLERVAVETDGFYTALPPHPAAEPDQVRWRLDEGRGERAEGELRGFAGLDSALRLRAVHQAPLPAWVPGHSGTALAFDGRGGYAESGFPGIPGTQARTVACWLRMPRDFTPADGFALVSWGQFSSAAHGAVWQVSLNPLAADGPLGRIRVGTHGGLLVGTTDLRDDAWHHVAVVMYGGAQPDIGTHVLVYLDGALETISRRTLRAIDTRIGADGHGVWIGRNITYTDEARDHPNAFLRGTVDDIVIAAGALSPAQIRALMAGTPR